MPPPSEGRVARLVPGPTAQAPADGGQAQPAGQQGEDQGEGKPAPITKGQFILRGRANLTFTGLAMAWAAPPPGSAVTCLGTVVGLAVTCSGGGATLAVVRTGVGSTVTQP